MEVDGAGVQDRPEHLQVFAQPADDVGPCGAESHLFGTMRPQTEAEAEVAASGRLGGQCLGGERQRVARVDRYDERADAEPRHGGTDVTGQ